jgi:hypothetical protein
MLKPGQSLHMLNVLKSRDGRHVLAEILGNCGVSIGAGIGKRKDETSHEFALNLLDEIMYNYTEEFSEMLKELKQGMYDGKSESSD